MSMTLASMDAQTREKRSGWAENDTAAQLNGLDPNVTVQAKPANVVATAKGDADPNWNHCDTKNDYK